jgi:methionyl aminopeptidase
MIKIKSADEIKKISQSGQIAAFALKQVAKNVRVGITTFELDQIAKRIITARGATPSFLDYRGYQHSTCISVNDEVVHGVPGAYKIKPNDIVKIDLGAYFNGYHSDTAITVVVGKLSINQKRLLEGTQKALLQTIKMVKPGIRVGDIEHNLGQILRSYNLGAVIDLSGHGIGTQIHEDPAIRCDGEADTGAEVKEGMVFALEPMATLGSPEVHTGNDKWTIVTNDGSMAAHFEHTIVVTKNGAKILT